MPHKNPEKRKAYNKKYREDHAEELLAYRKRYVAENLEDIRLAANADQPRRTIYMRGYRRSKGILPRVPKENLCGHTGVRHYGNNMCEKCWKRSQDPDKQREIRRKQRDRFKEKLGPEGYSAHLRKISLWTNYKITPEKHKEMVERQAGKCCCGKELDEAAKACVDHNHSCCPTNKTCGKCVRGILCMRCNMVLGLLEEDHQILPGFLSGYLAKYDGTASY